MDIDAKDFVRKCGKCQYFALIIGYQPEPLNLVVYDWAFAKYSINLISPLHIAQPQFKFCIVAIDYLTKWVEAEPLA